MSTENFKASRLTKGNLLFPTCIEVSDDAVTRRKWGIFAKNEVSIHIQKVASVRIKTGLIFSEILIESSGGADAILSHGHYRSDARRIKELVENHQNRHLNEGPGGPSKACPFCAETIKAAAKICRFCNRDLTIK